MCVEAYESKVQYYKSQLYIAFATSDVCNRSLCVSWPKTNNNNNNKLYLHDHNKVLQYCKSYLKLIIDSL